MTPHVSLIDVRLLRLARILIQRYEAVQQILARKVVIITAGVVWEVITQRGVWKFVRK